MGFDEKPHEAETSWGYIVINAQADSRSIWKFAYY